MPAYFENMEREDENVPSNSIENSLGPVWQLDSETDSCMLCKIIFTFTRRKHHCRMCGKIFCGDCAKHRIPVPFLNNIIARVCLLCFKNSNHSRMTSLSRESSKGFNLVHPVHVPYTLPSVVLSNSIGGRFVKSDMKEDDMMNLLSDEKSSTPLSFILNPNLVVLVKIIKVSKFPGQSYWLLVTQGLKVIGQDEVVMVLERFQSESVPLDMFLHFLRLYKEASFGYHQRHMTCSEPDRDSGFFFLYVDVLRLSRRSSDISDPRHRHHHHHHSLHPFHEIWEKFQFVPKQNFLLSVLMNREEFGAAGILPLRVMLRVAADQGYYPYPLISKRRRRSVFSEGSRSVLEKHLRSSESIVGGEMSGLRIIINQSRVLLEVPRSAYKKLMIRLNESTDTIFLLGDSNEDSCQHLICFEADDKSLTTSCNSCDGIDSEYDRESCGATFLVVERSEAILNCSFKVQEDGAVLELNTECFDRLVSSLRNMTDQHFESFDESRSSGGDDDDGDDDDDDVGDSNECIDVENHGRSKNQSFSVVWTNKEEISNIGVTSEVDGRLLEGIRSTRIRVMHDEEGVRFLERSTSSKCFQVQCGVPVIRWLEVFFLEQNIPEAVEDDFNVMNFVQKVGSTCCKVLQRHASLLDEYVSSVGVRVGVRQGNEVHVDAASAGKSLPGECSQDLERALTGFASDFVSSLRSSTRIITITTEFLFRVLSVNSTLRDCPHLEFSD